MLASLIAKAPGFPTTHWTIVHAVQQGSPEESAKALDVLCRSYWYPVYAFLRRSGQAAEDAEDLAQAFFLRLVDEDSLLVVRQEMGRLRTFLLAVLMRLLSSHTRHHAALKRGGGCEHLSFDAMDSEERYAHEPVDTRDPERLFYQTWAHELLDKVREQLRQHFAATGRAAVFELLLPFLTLDKEPPAQDTLARQLGSSEAATRVLIHRTRARFRELLQREVAQTVLTPEDLPGELAWLQSVLSERDGA